MVNHSMIKLVLFMAAGCIYMNLHKLDLNDSGIWQEQAVLMLVLPWVHMAYASIPLWNGYEVRQLLHEYSGVYRSAGPGRRCPALSGAGVGLPPGRRAYGCHGKAVCGHFLEKAPMGRERMTGKAVRRHGCLLCPGRLCLFLLLWGWPHRIMDYGRYQPSVLRGTGPHQVEYFSEANQGLYLHQHINRNSQLYVLFIRR